METASRTTAPQVPTRGQAAARPPADGNGQWLSGAKARCLITDAGSGAFSYDGLAVTRYGEDRTSDAEGSYLFLRDLDSDRVWSAGYQPTAAEPDEYEVELSAGATRLKRSDFGIRVETEICLCAETDIELRRYTLVNASPSPRRIEITSYLEWVLQHAAADGAHPAFSKLFVETEIRREQSLILARRRTRDPRDRTLAGAHWVVCQDTRDDQSPLEYETSRTRFVGRGRSLRAPAALDGHGSLSATYGPVLDPIASIRGTFYLEPNESASITLATTARHDQEALDAVVKSFTAEGVDRAFRAVAANARVNGASWQHDGKSTQALRWDPPHHRRSSSAAAEDFAPLRETSGDERRDETLQFDNGLGGFTPQGDEYVIHLRPDADGRLILPPTPWTHVVANPNAGFIATETGAGCTWTVNSRENRLTRWANDPVSDPHAEALYLRDRDRRTYWSPLPGPATTSVVHTVRYGFGYAQYEQTSAQLKQQVRQFVPREDSLKIIQLELQNQASTSRDLDLHFFAQLTLGNGTAQQSRATRTWFDETSGALFAASPEREHSHRVSFAVIVGADATGVESFTGDRAEFLGRYGEASAPAAVRALQSLSGTCGASLDPCAALQANLSLAAHAEGTWWILLGEADDDADARRLIQKYSTLGAIDAAFLEVTTFWRDTLSAVEIDTPSAAMNVMVNGWLPYQDLCCRIWGRSAYYQSGGAFGFRDQLQDAAALVYHQPAMTRRQILTHAAAQFVEGDVLHWWHPPAGRGVRTRFADDLLWLPMIAAEYVATTGDAPLWDEQTQFLEAPALPPGAAEKFLAPETSQQAASVYEHACRAIDRSLATGAHGLPLMGCGDWNDGMNRIGAEGRGESVWMAFFLDYVIQRMLPTCDARNDATRAETYREHLRRLRTAVAEHGWDGEWFRRAYFDDGAPLGTAANEECQIDALVQAWAVLSGSVEPDQARQGIDAVERRLVRDDLKLIQLLDPPFDKMSHNPGYIKGYLPGVRENGGQYTHGVLWFVRALAELGRGNRAVELLDMLNPVNHARNADEIAVYQVEPYVVAADVYSQPPHAGRGGWTWYTGSAGWMLRVAVESILGLRIEDGGTLVLNPCISAAWPRCALKYRLPDGGGVYNVTIENPLHRQRGVSSALADGRPAPVENGIARVPIVRDGGVHEVLLRL
jgi:N,N'-diacetylchitobiose phosphorylase